MIIECLLIAVIAFPAAVVFLRLARSPIGKQPRFYFHWTALLLSLVLAGHVLGEGQWTYPFQRWDVYTGRSAVTTEFVLVQAEMKSGEVIDFPFRQICGVSTRTITRSAIRLARQLASAEQAGDAARADGLRADLRQLGTMLTRARPTDPPTKMLFFDCRVDMAALPKRESVAKTLITDVTIER